MRRTTKLRTASAAGLAAALAVGGITPAFADIVVANDLATSGDTTLAAGATGTAKFHLVSTNNDGRTGCNASGSAPVEVAISSSNAAVVEFAAGAKLTFTGCEITNAQSINYTVKASAAKDATAIISGAASGGREANSGTGTGTFTYDSFVVKVAAPADSTDPTASHTVSQAANGAGWVKVEPVTVDISVSDETLLHSITYSLDGVTSTVQTANGVKQASLPVLVSGQGQHTLTYFATDGAGRKSETGGVSFGIDTVTPLLSGTPSEAGKNADGWYNAPVTVNWTASDATSGVVGGTSQTGSITGEGRGKTISLSVGDRAGNATAQVSSSPAVNIDSTAPSITGQVVKSTTDQTARPVNGTSPDGKGWYNTPALVGFTCADPQLADGGAGSGVAACPANEAVAVNGAGQSRGGDATDVAGNTASRTVSGINVDMAAPTTTSELSCGVSTFCKSTVTVDLTASDVTELADGVKTSLSGVNEIKYSTNGGTSWQTANGASKSLTIALNGTGKASVKHYAVDHAGNEGEVQSEIIKYDNIAPQVTGAKTPEANDAGWNKADTTVSFTAVDEEDGSGVNTSTITGPKKVTGETLLDGVDVEGSAADNAGNVGTTSVNVKIDRTLPTITAKTVNTAGAAVAANGAGWFNDSVKVDFTCTDALSGLASCTDDTVFDTDGTHTVTGQVSDIAGNNGIAATVSGIKIDATRPTVTVTGITNGGVYTLGAVPTASCTAADAAGGSGVVGTCTTKVEGGTANGVGTFTYTATARDAAGNVSDTTTIAYSVQYAWNGFLQPINDTAHQTGTTTSGNSISVFKAGSTVPAKFQLKNSAGAVVQATSAPQWLTPAKGGAVAAPVDEALYGDVATNGATFTWDATAQHYKYNWGTAKNQGGSYWRIGVKLDDGTVRYVNLGLRA